MPAHSFETSIGICRIGWEEGELASFSLPPAAGENTAPPPWVAAIISRVHSHLSGDLQDFSDLPFAWHRVTEFQQAVLKASLLAKPGQTWTYGQLAASVSPTTAARAVGTALGSNPWPLVVPCHRFVGADGRMTGFSSPGGIRTKLRLLVIEGAQMFSE